MSVATETNNRGEGNLSKGLAAGLIGGLVASWTMNRFQDVYWKLSINDHSTEAQSANGNSQEDDATVRTASALSEGIFDHQLSEAEKKIAGPAVHYSLGTGVGGLYGAAAEVIPEVTLGAGMPFGAAFWLVVDETAVPLLRLSRGPTAYPVSTHLYALTSHLVYGLTAELVRRFVRKAL